MHDLALPTTFCEHNVFIEIPGTIIMIILVYFKCGDSEFAETFTIELTKVGERCDVNVKPGCALSVL